MRWAVFVSGRGSNLKSVLEAEARGEFQKNKVVLVHANRDCPALEIAQSFAKPTHVLSPNAEGFEEQLLSEFKKHEVSHVFLLGYMRLLSEKFLMSFKGPVVNLHPSLLPAYKGLRAIERAFEAKEEVMGVSLHEVIVELDSGRILKQAEVRRRPEWSLKEAEQAIHDLEHKIVREYLLDLEAPLIRS